MIPLVFVELVSVGIDEISDFIELSIDLAFDRLDGLFGGNNILNF